MQLKKLTQDFTICKIRYIAQIDFADEFVFVSKTDDEISLVCESSRAPKDAIACEPGWRALKISGVLDFSMVGVIARITDLIAQAQISVFVVSTFNTDYILLKANNFENGVKILTDNEYTVI